MELSDTLIFPKSLTTIGDYAFNADGISSEFHVRKTKTTVDLSKTSITEIGRGAFWNFKVKEVSFPSTIMTIGDYAFRDCYVDTLDLGETKIKYIGDWAFYSSSSPKHVIIPSTIEYLGELSLANAEQVIFLGSTPPTLNGYEDNYGYMQTPFYSESFNNPGKTKIYVPDGTREAYINEPTWKELVDPDYVFEMSELTPVEQIKTDQSSVAEKDEIYDILGRKVTNPQKGIYIKNGKKVLLK